MTVERRGGFYLDGTSAVVGDSRDKAAVAAALGVGPPAFQVQSVDEYMESIAQSERRQPSGQDLALSDIRRSLMKDLEGHRAVVYRYVANDSDSGKKRSP